MIGNDLYIEQLPGFVAPLTLIIIHELFRSKYHAGIKRFVGTNIWRQGARLEDVPPSLKFVFEDPSIVLEISTRHAIRLF